MDIGYYCLAAAVTLWGAPQRVQANTTLLASGVDGYGSVLLDYGDFDVTLLHSKVSDSRIPSEIQGEEGSLLIEKLSEVQSLTLLPRGGDAQDLSQPQHSNTMLYEAQTFVQLVRAQGIDHASLEVSRTTVALLTEIRRQTGVVFPADADSV
nr:Inner membrane protein alx [Candidatus Pantoea persica]